MRKNNIKGFVLILVLASILLNSVVFSVAASESYLIDNSAVITVDNELEEVADSTKEETENNNDTNQAADSERSNGWNTAFWVGSAGCLVLAVVLAIRAGNKKYGK